MLPILFQNLAPRPTYTQKVQRLAPASLIAYWPLAEPSGTTIVDESGNARNGTYTATTLAQTGIGDGRTAASLDGSTSWGNLFSTSLQSAFGSAEGSAALWFKASGSGIWTDSTIRRFLTLQADGNNRVLMQRASGNNQISASYVAGGTTKSVTITTGGEITWLHLAITWSKSADQVKVYYNGAQSGATQTGLGTWAGSLASTTTLLGAATQTPTSVWSGLLAHVAIWTTPLTAMQITSLATL